ncbi:unnamed protein product [Alopecurus aequalis]
MKYFSLLLVVALAVWPLSTTAYIICAGDGRYTANSTYEANLRRLASTLPAEISSSQGLHTYRAIGYWPNRLRATWGCGDSADSSSSSCSACIAGGFRESVGVCPHRKDFFFSDHDCYLDIADFRVSERIFSPTLNESMALVMALQAVAFAFLLFLFLQEWRHRRGESMMRSSPLPSSGDK